MSVTETGEVSVGGPHEHFTSDLRVGWRPTNNRWASRWLLIGLVLACFFSMGRLVGAFQKEQEILRAKAIVAESFEIRGEDKKLKASLGKRPDGGAYLSFFDGTGNARLMLGAGANGAPIVTFFGDDKSLLMSLGLQAGGGTPEIALFDGKGEPALSLGIAKGIGPAVSLGQKGKGQILMSVANGRSSSIQISDSKNNPRISLSSSDTGPMMLLLGENSAIRASWTVHPEGAVSFSLRDGQSKVRLVIMTDKDGTPSVELLSPDGKVAKAL